MNKTLEDPIFLSIHSSQRRKAITNKDVMCVSSDEAKDTTRAVEGVGSGGCFRCGGYGRTGVGLGDTSSAAILYSHPNQQRAGVRAEVCFVNANINPTTTP